MNSDVAMDDFIWERQMERLDRVAEELSARCSRAHAIQFTAAELRAAGERVPPGAAACYIARVIGRELPLEALLAERIDIDIPRWSLTDAVLRGMRPVEGGEVWAERGSIYWRLYVDAADNPIAPDAAEEGQQ